MIGCVCDSVGAPSFLFPRPRDETVVVNKLSQSSAGFPSSPLFLCQICAQNKTDKPIITFGLMTEESVSLAFSMKSPAVLVVTALNRLVGSFY